MQTSFALTVTRRLSVKTSLLLDLSLVLFGSLLIALLAQVRVVLPFTPVPITAQTLGVLLIGAVLGSRRGAAAVIAYIVEGGLGLPFFAGGKAGLAVLMGPTGGYLLGFVAAAFVVGWLAERGLDRRVSTSMPLFVLGMAVIYAFGWLGLSRFVGMEAALAGGVLPFIFGDIVKVALAAALLPAAWRLLKGLEH